MPNAIDQLIDYACNYSELNMPFSTSLTTYSICATREEQLIDAAIQEKYAVLEHPNYEQFLSQLMIDAVHSRRELNQAQLDSIAHFLTDAITDLAECNMREDSDA